MTAGDGPAPRRFRRRLTLALTLVAAVAGGLLAVISYLVIGGYRQWTFEHDARVKAKLSVLSAPGELTLAGFDALLDEYRRRAGFETVAVAGDVVYSSTPDLGFDDVPVDVRDGHPRGELVAGGARVGGLRYLVLAGGNEAVDFYFFFSRAPIGEGLSGVKEILTAGWLAVVLTAALSARLVARRTLKPVRSAAAEARARAETLLGTRFELAEDDELEAWAQSYDQLAAALEAKIGALREAANRERRFTSDVAHELRTPLTAMVSAAALLEDEIDRLPPTAQRPARLLVDHAHRLRRVVLELLELARLDAGREAAEVEPLALRPALAAIVEGTDGQTPISIDVEPDDVAVLADRARLRRVVGNLVANAVRHGGGDIAVRGRPDGRWVVIEVLDRGPGIADAHLEHIFDRFYKADTSRSSAGSGLGLAIAAENTRLQGGTLRAGNRPGGGTRFTLRLPAPPASDGEEARTWPSESPDG